MSGVLHPVGPEPSETYWVRRALVVGVLLVLIIGLLIFLINLGGRPGQAAPATATAVPSSDAPSPTPSTDTPAPTDSASTSPEPSSSTATSSASTSASKTPTDAASSDPTPTASASDSAATPTPGADDAQSSKPRTAVCDPADLRGRLTSSSRNVSTDQQVTFRQSVINKSSKPCTIKLNSDNYELKIYSGTDRIWSTNDCAKLVPDVSKRVKPDASVAWKTTWNGKRSQQGESCQSRPEIPQPGYYYATSQLEGAEPVQVQLVLS